MSKTTMAAPAKFKGTVEIRKGIIRLPYKNYRHLKVQWASIRRGPVKGLTQSVIETYRNPKKDKPYVPFGTLWIDGKWYKVVNKND